MLQPAGGGSPKDDNAQQSGDSDNSNEEQSGDSEEESEEEADQIHKAKLLG